MERHQLLHQFYSIFGDTGVPPALYFAPGRINLIGEHTDYNGGFVLPGAIQYGTWLAIRPIDNPVFRFFSANFPFRTDIPMAEAGIRIGKEWVNYPLGVIYEFMDRGVEVSGLELFFAGDIPNGAGLSSSASIEMVTAYALNTLTDAGCSLTELAELSQRAENLFVGVQCGIMDQYAVGLGESAHALLLNCRTLDHKPVPLPLDDALFVIVNTNKQRSLTDSKYNERVEECQQALAFLKETYDIDQLGQLSFMQFYKHQHLIPDERLRRRARHVISENQRVLNAVTALNNGNLSEFGALMYASHESLRDNYEVTGSELDTLVEAASGINGVLGSRMTGAGFGGCTISLVKKAALTLFQEQLPEIYHRETGLTADLYIAEIVDGVRLLK